MLFKLEIYTTALVESNKRMIVANAVRYHQQKLAQVRGTLLISIIMAKHCALAWINIVESLAVDVFLGISSVNCLLPRVFRFE